MGIPWLQTKEYRCVRCGEFLLHDAMYHHSLFLCPLRPAARLKVWLETGRRYEPVSGRG